MADDAEIAFEDDGSLFLGRDPELAEIEEQPVKVAVHPVLGRLHTTDVLGGPLFAGLAGRGCWR